MVSAAAHKEQRLFSPKSHKDIIRDQLKTLVTLFGLRLSAWVILDNHYHLLIKSSAEASLMQFIRRLHGRTSHDINVLDQYAGRQVWDNYWDHCIRSESDYWTRFNYIHHNPIKHGYVRNMDDWSYSSYSWYNKHKGEEWLVDAFARYPIIDYTEVNDKD
jgi:putative transposase